MRKINYLNRFLVMGLCLLLLMLCFSGCGKKVVSGTEENKVEVADKEQTVYEEEISERYIPDTVKLAPAEDPVEILYTRTPNVVPELYIQFDVNPSVGFYVDKEPGYPVCGVVYNNEDAKRMLDDVRILDGSVWDCFAALYSNLVREGYVKETEERKYVDIAISYYEVGKCLGDNRFELTEISDKDEISEISDLEEIFTFIADYGEVKLNSGDGFSPEFMAEPPKEYEDIIATLERDRTGEESGDKERREEIIEEVIEEESHEEVRVACTDCGGSGYAACTICGGRAITDCEFCEGTGMLVCDLCGGTTDQLCTNCSVPTDGVNPGNGLCNGCNGTGICKYCGGAGCAECDYQTGVTCKGCAGSGVCGHCQGTGITKGTCPRCFGNNGKMFCYHCDGKGQKTCYRCVENPGLGICERCHGSGEIVSSN